MNVPVIADKLLVRVAGQMQQRDGYTKNLQDGSYLDDRNYYAWRVGVTLRPTDDFENYFLYDGYWQDSHGASNMLAAINPIYGIEFLLTHGTIGLAVTLAHMCQIARGEHRIETPVGVVTVTCTFPAAAGGVTVSISVGVAGVTATALVPK